jgi:hypothetical protein
MPVWADINRGRRIRISTIRMQTVSFYLLNFLQNFFYFTNGFDARKTTLRILAQRLFDAWEEAMETGKSSSSKPPQPPMNLLLQSKACACHCSFSFTF